MLGLLATRGHRRRVVLEDATQERRCVVDHGRNVDGAVVVRISLRAEEGGKECHEGKYVWQADGVVLQAAPEGGDVVCRGAPQGEKLLKAGGQADLLLRWNGERVAKGVHDDARVGDALRGLLPLLVAKSQAQGACEPVPVGLGAPGRAGRTGADGATAGKALARGVRLRLGNEDGVVDPHDGVECLGVKAALYPVDR